jgi:hypothetical protein
MPYAKVNGNTVEQYPYKRSTMYKDFPDLKRRAIMPPSELPDGVVVVVGETPESFDRNTQTLSYADMPVLQGGKWVLPVTVSDKTAEEIALETAGSRQRRDALLAETDHWAFPDTPDMTPEQIAYRQALRDITDHVNWPHLSDDDWPSKPA